jgi:hypothetical protein
MKRIFITLLFVFAVAMSAQSQVVFTENFSYPAGDSIGSHGWNGFSSAVNPIFVVAPGLTYAGYPQSNIGNSCYMNKTGEDSYKDATATDSVGSYYLSFMLKVDTARTGDYFIALLPAANTTNYNLRVKITANGAGFYSLGLGKGSAGDTVSNMGVTFPIGATILVVGKYTFVSGASNDQLALYAFTSGLPATEPVTPLVVTPTVGSADLANVGRVGLRQGGATSGASLYVDGIKVSKSWTQVITNVITTSTVADKFALSQNYPNPFNPSTTIKFSLPSAGMTSLKVYDAMGKEVSSLVNGNLSAGQYSAQFNGASLASGMYFYKLEFTGVDGKTVSEQKKLMLVK